MKLHEWHRTIILLVLIVIAISYIIWLRTGFQSGLLENLGR